MQTDALTQALIPAIIALVTLLVAVIGVPTMMVNRMRVEIARVDAESKAARAEAEARRKTQQATEDALHEVTLQLNTITKERDDLIKRVDEMARQFCELSHQQTELLMRYTTLDKQMHEMRDKMESDRIFAQGKIDAAMGAKERAEREALVLRKDIETLEVQKSALIQRLEDQATAHAAELKALNERAGRMEAELRLQSLEIDRRVATATAHLREQVDALIKTRETLEDRVRELERGGKNGTLTDGRGADLSGAADGRAGDGAGRAGDEHPAGGGDAGSGGGTTGGAAG